MKTYGGLEVIAQPFLTLLLDGGEWSASCPGRVIPREPAPGIYCVGGWVGPGAGLGALEKRKMLPLSWIESGLDGCPSHSLSPYRSSCYASYLCYMYVWVHIKTWSSRQGVEGKDYAAWPDIRISVFVLEAVNFLMKFVQLCLLFHLFLELFIISAVRIVTPLLSRQQCDLRFIKCEYTYGTPTDGVSTLSWWWGLSAPETVRAMPAVVSLLVGAPMLDRSRGRSQTKRDTLVLQVGGLAWG
jgi:hypothetical protein